MRKLLLAGVSSILLLSQSGCAAADNSQVISPQIAQDHILKGGTALNDVLSKNVVGESYLEGKETVAVILLGDRAVLELQDGKTDELGYGEAKRPVINVFGTGMWILSHMFTYFKKQKEVVGQANLSLLVKDDHTCEILSKTIYVPGCAPYTGGKEIPPPVKEFWQQVKSAVEAIEPRHLKLPSPEVKSQTVEIVIGRDPSMFPRHATPFNGMIVRDPSGKTTHVKSFVRDFGH